MLRHPDFLYAFDVRGLYFHANLITEISTKVKLKKCLRHFNPLAPIHGGIRGFFLCRFPA